MRELKVIDVDGLTLIVANGEGEEFRVPVDEASLLRLRGARSASDGPRVSPKDIQAHIRAGLSTEEVAALTGASVELVQRFEGPVLAEREFIINSALAVSTHSSIETDTGSITSAFGDVIRARLASLGGSQERWASWKDADGSWVVKLEFTANGIDHDARWSFEPRKHVLTPLNTDASTLSQKGDISTGLIPKLRAVGTDTVDTGVLIAAQVAERNESQALLTAVLDEPTSEGETQPHSPTADLLEALRKRRSEREDTPAWLREEISVTETVSLDEDGNIGAVTINIEDSIEFTEPFDADTVADNPVSSEPHNDSKQIGKNGRPAMPSWDEIVFGTRSDDDPA